jgi:hypothetical protein
MKFLVRQAAGRYRNWMYGWENGLANRSTDRIVRPFEFGLDWCVDWPCTKELPYDGSDPVQYIEKLNRHAIANHDQFFAYTPPTDFKLHNEADGQWLRFTSPVSTRYPENNTVHCLWYPARGGGRKAMTVLPHWNSKLPQHNALCAGLQRLGISVLRLSLPYHDARMPEGLQRADYAVSSNICRTIDATRQAVLDTRATFDWLEREGYKDLGVVGTSLGSCYAFLASAFDPRIRVNVFNHCSTYFADVVWEGLSSRHIRESLEGNVDLDTLRRLWLAISPPSYYDIYATNKRKKSKFIYTRYDTTFPLHLSRQVIEGARRHNWDHDSVELLCGHYTMGEFPFKFLTGYEICSFAKRHL